MSDTTFRTLGVPASIAAVLEEDGKSEAFPIQADTLPDSLASRDVLGRGRTGSGKTLAFSIPLAARLAGGRTKASRPRGLVLAPTRELATQINAALAPLAAASGLTTTTVFGGVSQGKQVTALRSGVDIVVACPGRLDDLRQQGHVDLGAVEITVLDEADHMADLGFLPVVTRLMQATPQVGQRMLFSATLDRGVDKLVRRFLDEPVLHSVDDETSPVEAMTHHVFEVEDRELKKELVKRLASGMGRRMLFTRTKHQAKKLARQLTAAGIPAVDLHGNLSQPQRDRNLKAFGDGSAKVLVATDIAARGVHVDDVELVVHVDPPVEHKAYLHRSGRTARAGNAGTVVTVCLPEQRDDLRKILRKAEIRVTPVTVTADSPEVADLVGEIAPYVAPAPKQPSGGGGTSQGANARRKRAAREARQQGGSGQQGASRQQGANQQRGDAGSRRRRGGSGPRRQPATQRGGQQSAPQQRAAGHPHAGNPQTGAQQTATQQRATQQTATDTRERRGPRRASRP